MDKLPDQTSTTRLQIFEVPEILLGGQRCPSCGGEGHIPWESDEGHVPGYERECEGCDGTGSDPLGPQPIDILPALEHLSIDISGSGAHAQILLAVDVGPADFNMDTVTRVVDAERKTPEELGQLVASCPTSRKVGDYLAEHLYGSPEGG